MGISACLLGQKVRYDGGHKRDPGLLANLGRVFEWVPVCPEVELGLGTPRPPLRLEGDPRAPRLMFVESREEITRMMRDWSRRRLEALEAADLCGFVLKRDSPSCGLERVPVHRARGGPARRAGSGLFAAALRKRFPRLPLEEGERLHDTGARRRFIERVRAYRRRRDAAAAPAARMKT
ncbi:MAG: DUF523 domain-containing protein, partial [Candidatus Polarisedimenticolia bacterium]